ncbi:MAG TPA: hypothetical protein DCQ25_01290 [Elusimicrobia bacterium]|nr:hypothetical protein [Elusimicrobiota bacterium]
MKTKPQILYIHGGSTFSNRADYLRFLKNRPVSSGERIRWNEAYLDRSLGAKCEIIRPKMPCPERAAYADWKVHLERHIPLLRDNVILAGTSLGGIFLARYLAENRFPKKILSAYLICPPFDNTLPTEEICCGFRLPRSLELLEKNCDRLTLCFSSDDTTVPASHAKKYARRLKKARILVYDNKNGHFKVPEFPELVRMIKSDLKDI